MHCDASNIFSARFHRRHCICCVFQLNISLDLLMRLIKYLTWQTRPCPAHRRTERGVVRALTGWKLEEVVMAGGQHDALFWASLVLQLASLSAPVCAQIFATNLLPSQLVTYELFMKLESCANLSPRISSWRHDAFSASSYFTLTTQPLLLNISMTVQSIQT